ncbi:MAG: aminotransferase class V-fold PLP-dependent enzyme, partial [Actinobacteria bacterium]
MTIADLSALRDDSVPQLDLARIRADFPILGREINGYPLVYLDSANTSQKPRQVIEAMREHYAYHNANVARSV